MTVRRPLLVVVAAALLVAGLVGELRGAPTVTVAAGEDVAAAAAANPGAVLELGAGVHDGFRLDDPVTVRGGPDVTVRGPIEVFASGTRLEDLTVEGGVNGILVRDADAVTIDGVSITGAELHGIEVVDSVVAIRDCSVAGLTGERAQGIEIRNAAGRGRSLIEGCAVSSGQEGLVTHVSRAELRGNTVTGTTMRAIAIMEMSEVLAVDNRVEDVVGAAIFCGDMSTCDVQRNVVRDVHADGSAIRSRSGQAAIVWYYSGMRLVGNDFDVAAEPAIEAYQGGVLTDRSPLGVWPNGWRGMLPAIPISAAALAGLAVTAWGVGRLLRRRADGADTPSEARYDVSEGLYAVVVGGFAIQTFHMVEHVVQLWQVHGIDAEVRAGLIGQSLNVEWTHLTFNVAVLAFLGAIWYLGRRSTASLAGASPAAAWFLASIVAQTYHTFEHVVKIAQRIQTGVDPAPGVFGDDLGLVWFHYAINLVVEVGAAVGIVAVIRERRAVRDRDRVPAGVGEPTPA